MGRARNAAILALLSLSVASHTTAAEQATNAVGRWFDPATAPFIPVPEIDVDPNSGTTLGIIPTWLATDEHGNIQRIYAPDLILNPYFGYGARARVFAYPSADRQWSIVGGAKERVESEFDAQYESGRRREGRWSVFARAVYDRSGTPRFYGIGNNSGVFDRTVYTNQQEYFIAQLGLNLTRHWQLAYSVSPRKVKILPGRLAAIIPIDHRFPGLLGIGVTHELLNRLLLTYDTRDDPTVPTAGMAVVVYAGLASRNGAFNDSLFSEAGGDVRWFWSPTQTLTWALHTALRYLPTHHHVPFWALSSIGGDESVIGGEQPLRGYGVSRFYDRNSFSASLEMRRQVASFDAVSTHIELQFTPFIDTGRVFAHASAFPVTRLHTAVGVGIRAVARPFVVGYLDVGKGSEGVVAFTGINYPF
jgi:surface antigen Omp85-like protein